jgi:4-hydroxybenzoyl-CoA reductase subunit beta
MLRLPPFTYLAPKNLTEATRLCAEHGADAMFVAGGTDLYPNMKRRQFEPKVLVGLRRLREIREIRRSDENGWSLGAGVTLTQLTNHPAIQHDYSALATAASLIATPPIQNMGTYGGNLCLDTRCNYYNQTYFWRKAIGFCMKKDGDICLVAPGSPRCVAVSSTDTAPVTIALDAQVRLVGPKGERIIAARELYYNDGMNYLTKAPDEILTDVILPPAAGLKSVYLKLRRRGSFDFPLLGVAVALRQDGDGTVTHARIVLGAVQSYPLPCDDAAQMLIGQKLTPDVIEAVAQAAYKPAKPLDNADMTHGYRKKMTKVYLARALHALADTASIHEGLELA